MSTLKLGKSDKSTLEFVRSKIREFLYLVFLTAFFTAWYYLIVKDLLPEYSFFEAISKKVADDKLTLLFLCAPLLSLNEFIRKIKYVLYGERIALNKIERSIKRNDIEIANFSDIEYLQIRTISDSESSDTYRLSLRLKSGRKIYIDESGDKSAIYGIADEMADFLDVKVTQKQ